MRKVHRNLISAIGFIKENKQHYVKNPTKDFTRDRKLNMEETIRLILSMEGGSLNKELYSHSKQAKVNVTSSAFVQQRSKISSDAFRDLFYHFNANSRDIERYKGYRIFAVDGSDINHYRNPDADSYITNRHYPHGFNQTHLYNLIFTQH